MLYINHRSFAVSDYQLLNLKEKSESLFKGNPHQCRTPPGVRGLKRECSN